MHIEKKERLLTVALLLLFTTGGGFGGRFYSRKRSNISLSLNFNASYLRIKTDGFQGFSSPQSYTPIYVTTTF